MAANRRHRVVVAESLDPEALDSLRKEADVEVLLDSSPDAMIRALPGADALIVRSKAHVTARILEAATDLKVIGRASPTIDHIDIRAAGRRNISIVYTPNVAVPSVVEFTMAMILATHRRIIELDGAFRDGKFETLRDPMTSELGRCTIGLVGIDSVADRVGAICLGGFGSRVIYHDPEGNAPTEFQAESREIDALMAESDIISVHFSHLPKQKKFISAERIARMKPTAILINTSRGAAVDTTALADALTRGRIAGAALDVFETEPLAARHPLRRAPNCILTPHVAAATIDARKNRYRVADDVLRVLKGEAPEHPYTPPAGRV